VNWPRRARRLFVTINGYQSVFRERYSLLWNPVRGGQNDLSIPFADAGRRCEIAHAEFVEQFIDRNTPWNEPAFHSVRADSEQRGICHGEVMCRRGWVFHGRPLRHYP